MAGARSMTSSEELAFPPGFLALLERLRILALRAAGGGLREGRRLGAYRGGQLEFHDHRAYAPGDDLRYLDWNLYARLDRPFIKEFVREEAGAMHLLLDATPSMALGTPAKWTFTRRLAALLGHVAWGANDRVQAYIFGATRSRLDLFPPPALRANTQTFLQWLGKRSPGGGFAGLGEAFAGDVDGAAEAPVFLEAVHGFLRTHPARGRIFILSDFWFELAELSEGLQRLSSSGFDLAAIHVLAPEETRVLDEGALRILAVEEPGEIELDATPAAVERYGIELNAHLQHVEQLFQRRGGFYLYEHADTPLERVLIDSLKRRRWLG